MPTIQSIFIFGMVLLKCAAGQSCYSDLNCLSPERPICDIGSLTCVAEPPNNCTLDSQCMSSLKLCNTSIHMCIPVSCTTNANCSANNSQCDSDICACKDGFSELNGNCSKVLGRNCIVDQDCDTAYTACTNGICVCQSSYYYEKNGVCASIIGKNCTQEYDCGSSFYYYQCTNESCSCRVGYTSHNGLCEYVIGRQCINDTDCPLPNALCLFNRCTCKRGMVDNGAVCTKALGNYCNTTSCPRYYNYGQVTHYGMYCNEQYMCTCGPGYKPDQPQEICIPVLDTQCNVSKECGDHPGYRCTSNTCNCTDTYIKQLYESYSIDVCMPVLGQKCSSVACNINHSFCDGLGVCSCLDGFFEVNGDCSPVFGASCSSDIICSLLPNARCSVGGKCECTSGFKLFNNTCIEVLGTECTTDNNCPLDNAICSSAAKCTCKDGFPKFQQQCLRTACHQTVPILPDLQRRSRMHTVNYLEELVNDVNLAEAWYSIKQYRISASTDNPVTGQCGTTYPVYLKNVSTSQQYEDMMNNEITVPVIIGGYGVEINIKLRICGDDTHVYMGSSKINYSALCIENTFSRPPYYYWYYSYIQPNLDFYNDTRNGTLMNIPNNIFQCVSYEYNYYNNYEKENYGYYYIVYWYVNNKLLTTFGPVVLRNIANLKLSEHDLVNAGYTVGITLRCAYEIFSPLSSNESWHYFSDQFNTQIYLFQDVLKYVAPGSNASFPFYPAVPLGCAAPANDKSLYCSLKYDIVDVNGTSMCTAISTNISEMCGIRLTGITKTGLEYHGRWQLSYWMQWVNGTYCYVDNALHIQTEKFANYKKTYRLKARFQRKLDGTGHKLWENYTPPDLEIKVLDSGRMWAYSSCNIDGYSSSWVVNKYSSLLGFSESFSVHSTINEYLLFRSKEVPFEIQMKIYECSYNTQQQCPCAISIRDRNSIIICDRCGGSQTAGFIYGNGSYINGSDMDSGNDYYRSFMIESIEGLSVSLYCYSEGNVRAQLYLQKTDMTFEDGEGICMFKPNEYRTRDGTVLTTSDGFAEGWRISTSESLLNSSNHVPVAWNDTSYFCSCPPSNETVPETDICSTSDTVQYVHNSAGMLKCTRETFCTTEHKGKAWLTSLLPDYAINNISISTTMVYTDNIPVVHFYCNFKAVDGYLYKTEWQVDNKVVLKSDYLSATETLKAFLTDDDLSMNSDSQFILDVDIVCGVSVYRANKTLLVNAAYSTVFRPVRIVDTVVNMMRGWDATIKLVKNVPFGCQPGAECTMEFLLYDPDDKYDCRDSSVAVKSKSTCGKQLYGAMSPQAIINRQESIDLIITTKNNNKYSMKNVFNLRLKVKIKGHGKKIYSGEFKSNITVIVNDHAIWPKHYCYANNDPRMGTFDGIYYSNQIVDEFVMLRHKILPVEIQMKTSLCNGGWASCACGVTVRAGWDVFTINHCEGEHITGYLSNGDGILVVRRRSANRYEIGLPHGTVVDVQISISRWYMVSLNIYPSPADVGNIEGLCGNFNGIVNDDFTHRDGTVEKVSSNYYHSPDDFSRSWGLDHSNKWDSESLLNPAHIKSLDGWNNDQQLCVCPGKGDDVPLCSANEDNTCTEPVEKPGEKLDIKKRKDRSVEFRNFEYDKRLLEMRKRSQLKKVYKRSINENNTISIDEAMLRCNYSLTSGCQLFKMANETPVADVSHLIQDCAQDLAINSNIDWSNETCTRYQGIVDKEVSRDNVFQTEHPDIVSKIVEQNCIGNCTGNGVCNNGSCICDSGFSSDDCSVNLSIPPNIEGIHGGGRCDKKTDGDCTCIRITTSGNVATAQCRISLSVAGKDGYFGENQTYTVPANVENYNELFCCIPQYARKKRSTTGRLALAQKAGFSVSNNGQNFGQPSYVFVLDSTCQEVLNDSNGQTVALLKSGYCFIQGQCYTGNTISTSDSCYVCKPDQNLFDWSSAGCSADETKGSSVKLYIIITVAVVAVVIAVIVVIIVVLKCKPKQAVAPSVGLYDFDVKEMPHNKKFHLRLEPRNEEFVKN